MCVKVMELLKMRTGLEPEYQCVCRSVCVRLLCVKVMVLLRTRSDFELEHMSVRYLPVCLPACPSVCLFTVKVKRYHRR